MIRLEEKIAHPCAPVPRHAGVHGHGTTFDPAELEHLEYLLAADMCMPFDALHRKAPVTWTLTQQKRGPRSGADIGDPRFDDVEVRSGATPDNIPWSRGV